MVTAEKLNTTEAREQAAEKPINSAMEILSYRNNVPLRIT
jgi:hypothetical protein|tara:strand:- start:775 stop:894 length:120 start_codon:yes stop_codon:yes gene_type:complete